VAGSLYFRQKQDTLDSFSIRAITCRGMALMALGAERTRINGGRARGQEPYSCGR